jgi:hypothetical protein
MSSAARRCVFALLFVGLGASPGYSPPSALRPAGVASTAASARVLRPEGSPSSPLPAPVPCLAADPDDGDVPSGEFAAVFSADPPSASAGSEGVAFRAFRPTCDTLVSRGIRLQI